MNGRTRKPVGWRLEPGRHSLASRGIKTGQKRYQRKPRAYKSPQPLAPPESTDFFTAHRGEKLIKHENYSLSIDAKGGLDLNLDDPMGWTWGGGEKELLGFLTRLSASKMLASGAVRDLTEKAPFQDFKPLLLESAESGDGLYEASGDNKLWESGDFEYTADDMEWLYEQLPKEEHEAFGEYFNDKANPDLSFKTFEKENKGVWVSQATGIIKSSEDWKDLADKLKDAKEDWMFGSEGAWDWMRTQWDNEAARLREQWDADRPKRLEHDVKEAVAGIKNIQPDGLTAVQASAARMRLQQKADETIAEMPEHRRVELETLISRERMKAAAKEPEQKKLR
jgi:hypothetical protein